MKISAIDIKRLWYADCISKPLYAGGTAPAGGTHQSLYDLVKTDGSAVEILNVHQDTWQIEESEASQDSYRNQLTGRVYRLGKRQGGDLTIAFTVGQYDYKTKAALMGGKVLKQDGSEVSNPTGGADEVGWSRGDVQEMYKTLIALTVDDVYVVLSRASIGAREANTDKAIGMAVSGTMTDPIASGVSPEYWYDAAKVVPAPAPAG